MNSITDSLISWLQTFNVSAPHKTVDQLSDGVALAQVLHKIDPDFFDASWLSKVKTDVGKQLATQIQQPEEDSQGDYRLLQ
ncbi:hypothetical protein MTO96_014086 [Rhipicephalus appendiculatus]